MKMKMIMMMILEGKIIQVTCAFKKGP